MSFRKRHPSKRFIVIRDHPEDPCAWFESVVADTNLCLWKPGDPVINKGVRLLVGVATWSGYDLELLDHVSDFLTENAMCKLRVDVFVVDGFVEQAEFRKYYPVDVDVVDTPVAGKWVDGIHERTVSGAAASELVREYL